MNKVASKHNQFFQSELEFIDTPKRAFVTSPIRHVTSKTVSLGKVPKDRRCPFGMYNILSSF